MTLLDRLNALSKVILGVGIVDLWKQASQSKVEAQKAERLARDKHLREAAKMAEKLSQFGLPSLVSGKV